MCACPIASMQVVYSLLHTNLFANCMNEKMRKRNRVFAICKCCSSFLFFFSCYNLTYDSTRAICAQIKWSYTATRLLMSVSQYQTVSPVRPSVRPSVTDTRTPTLIYIHNTHTLFCIWVHLRARHKKKTVQSPNIRTHFSLFHLFAVFFFLRLFLSSVQFCVVVFAARAVFFFYLRVLFSPSLSLSLSLSLSCCCASVWLSIFLL